MVALVAAFARASIEEQIGNLKEQIYRLALEEISEGVRAQRLRSLVNKLHEIQASAERPGEFALASVA